MRAPTAAELLDLWEVGAGSTPVTRSLALLELGSPRPDADELAALPVGAREARLLDLRELLFGPDLVGISSCDGCGEVLEFSCPVQDLRAPPPREEQAEVAVSASGYDVLVRLPTSGDLAALAGERDPGAARELLLERCVVSATRDCSAAPASELPEEVVWALDERLAEVDPQADCRVELTCPGCGERRSLVLDVGAFLWAELDAWARRTVHDVHVLASAYGWTETEILALGARRRLYLELAAG